MSNPAFIKQDINNGALTAIKAMPQKDSTSDNTSDFELSRKIYEKTYSPVLTNAEVLAALKPAHFGMNSFMRMNRIRPTVFDGQQAPIQKKWSANRDASQVTVNRRTNSVGTGSLNYANRLTSFTTYKDVNVVNDALRRVRGGGAVAPPKKAASPSQTFVPSPGTHPYMQPGFKGKIGNYFPNSRYNSQK
jgi:hypothetical protein